MKAIYDFPKVKTMEFADARLADEFAANMRVNFLAATVPLLCDPRWHFPAGVGATG